jgi:hypothetical protein
MRSFAPDQSISAWHGIQVQPLDFAAHPIHPAGQLVVAHDPPQQRASWAKHGTRGFYLSPALSHYRSHVVFIPSTLATRITNQLDFFPDPLFTFEDPTISAPPPDPTTSRPSPTLDGSDLIGQVFVDPELGLCRVTGHGQPSFLQPNTGNLATGQLLIDPRLAPHPLLHHTRRHHGTLHHHRSGPMGPGSPSSAFHAVYCSSISPTSFHFRSPSRTHTHSNEPGLSDRTVQHRKPRHRQTPPHAPISRCPTQHCPHPVAARAPTLCETTPSLSLQRVVASAPHGPSHVRTRSSRWPSPPLPPSRYTASSRSSSWLALSLQRVPSRWRYPRQHIPGLLFRHQRRRRLRGLTPRRLCFHPRRPGPLPC